MNFIASLIESKSSQFLKENATHVAGDFWLYEGLIECIEADFKDHGEAVVQSLGGLSEVEIILLAHTHFGLILRTVDGEVQGVVGGEVESEEMDKNIDRLVGELADLLMEKKSTYYIAFSRGETVASHTNVRSGYHVDFLLDMAKATLSDERVERASKS